MAVKKTTFLTIELPQKTCADFINLFCRCLQHGNYSINRRPSDEEQATNNEYIDIELKISSESFGQFKEIYEQYFGKDFTLTFDGQNLNQTE